MCKNGQAAVDLQRTDLHEEVGRREDAQTDGEEDPALHAAPCALVFHQLLTDLAVNLIPAKEKTVATTRRHQVRRRTTITSTAMCKIMTKLKIKIIGSFYSFTLCLASTVRLRR